MSRLSLNLAHIPSPLLIPRISTMPSDIQSISIISTQTVPKPKPHTTYTIQGMSRPVPNYYTWLLETPGLNPVQTPIRTWTIDRRYNDFVALHSELVSSTGKEPPALMPSKHLLSFTRSAYDDKVSSTVSLVSLASPLTPPAYRSYLQPQRVRDSRRKAD